MTSTLWATSDNYSRTPAGIKDEDATYQDYKGNHLLTDKVKEELDDFFDRKEEGRRIENPDKAAWTKKTEWSRRFEKEWQSKYI